MHTIPRRKFLSLAGAAPLMAAPQANTFRFALIADSHIIDSMYKGPESNPEDTESILHSAERLTSAREVLNALKPAPERVFLVGDYFHNYPSEDVDFYFKNETRLDIAKKITDGFHVPVHVGFGNHDYAVPRVSREMSHELFRRKFNVKPYYLVEHKGFKFVHLNNFLGNTWTPGHAAFNKNMGSLGEEQLNWFEAEMREHKPTFVFVHYPLTIVQPKEVADYGLHALVKKYRENIQLVVSGHWHRWFEFGRSFGPQHLVMAATRYDPNAYLIVDVDTRAVTHKLVNLDLVDWNTHFSKPYRA
uniref:Metallophosphoesterase n=1 Tax=Solibacter usitatus (strain Ellin6076) TaxID=234267 RepID=Q01UQ5_SOLUE